MTTQRPGPTTPGRRPSRRDRSLELATAVVVIGLVVSIVRLVLQ